MNDFAVYLFYLFVFSPTYKVREWNRIGKKRFIMTYKDTIPMKQDNLKQVEYLTGIKVVATVERGQKDIKLLEELWTGRKKI